jgi:hypothetical protein
VSLSFLGLVLRFRNRRTNLGRHFLQLKKEACQAT